MRTHKFIWETHKWIGIVLAIFYVNLAVTGFLLLIKKKHDWIQPAEQTPAAGEFHEFVTLQEVVAEVLNAGHPDFKSVEDIDRIDVRPGKRIHKVISVHNYTEMQVDAVTGEILSVAKRRSDFFEKLHDGSWYADRVHDWVMPVVAVGLLTLSITGLYLWYVPWRKRRQIRRRRAARG